MSVWDLIETNEDECTLPYSCGYIPGDRKDCSPSLNLAGSYSNTHFDLADDFDVVL